MSSYVDGRVPSSVLTPLKENVSSVTKSTSSVAQALSTPSTTFLTSSKSTDSFIAQTPLEANALPDNVSKAVLENIAVLSARFSDIDISSEAGRNALKSRVIENAMTLAKQAASNVNLRDDLIDPLIEALPDVSDAAFLSDVKQFIGEAAGGISRFSEETLGLLTSGFKSTFPTLTDEFGEVISGIPSDLDPTTLDLLKQVATSALGFTTNAICADKNYLNYRNRQGMFDGLLNYSIQKDILCMAVSLLQAGLTGQSTESLLRNVMSDLTSRNGTTQMIWTIVNEAPKGIFTGNKKIINHVVKKGNVFPGDAELVPDIIDALSDDDGTATTAARGDTLWRDPDYQDDILDEDMTSWIDPAINQSSVYGNTYYKYLAAEDTAMTI